LYGQVSFINITLKRKDGLGTEYTYLYGLFVKVLKKGHWVDLSINERILKLILREDEKV
jgi:hypothetical protein